MEVSGAGNGRSRRPVEPERKAERGECTGSSTTYSVQKIIFMAYRFFTIAIRAPEAAQAELNGFLRNHRVLVVGRRWVDQGENSLWAFCVDYLESSARHPCGQGCAGPEQGGLSRAFESISHAIMGSRLGRLFKDRRLLDLLRRIIASFESAPGRGLPIGSLTSQHFANFYLGWFDRFVKEGLLVEGYVRYMDDCALWANTSDQLADHLAASAAFLESEEGFPGVLIDQTSPSPPPIAFAPRSG